MPKVNTRIEDIETAKRLPEYNVMFAVEVATTVNYMPLMDHDTRDDESFLNADADEPVSIKSLTKLRSLLKMTYGCKNKYPTKLSR